MARTGRLLLAMIIVGLAAVVLRADPAAACSCGVSIRPAPSYERAALVFGGTVSDVDQELLGSGQRISVDVDRVYKGEVARRVSVATPSPNGSCGLPLRTGSYYVLFAPGGTSTQVRAILCDGFVRGRTDRFGPGREPVPVPRVRRLGPAVAVGSGLLVVAGLTLLTVMVRRRPGPSFPPAPPGP